MNGRLYEMVASGPMQETSYLSVSTLQHTERMEVKICGFLISTSREMSGQLHSLAT
jgi:hypothetical protein